MPETPAHFTYERFDACDDLYQGDILRPSSHLLAVLADVHPHFKDTKYTSFAVLTQTCDLVRRDNNECKSSYINIAVVRPLESVLLTFLDKCCQRARLAHGIYQTNAKERATSFLERLLDQNEQSMGLFYLHPDAAVGVAVPSVVMLQVNIALRAAEHYEVVRSSRIGRLRAEFRNKLGWLIGNLYGRVATDDSDENIRNQIIKDFLGPEIPRHNSPRWIAKKDLKRMQTATSKSFDELTPEEIDDLLKEQAAPTSENVAIERMEIAMRKAIPNISDDQVRHVARILRNDPRFEIAFR